MNCPLLRLFPTSSWQYWTSGDDPLFLEMTSKARLEEPRLRQEAGKPRGSRSTFTQSRFDAGRRARCQAHFFLRCSRSVIKGTHPNLCSPSGWVRGRVPVMCEHTHARRDTQIHTALPHHQGFGSSCSRGIASARGLQTSPCHPCGLGQSPSRVNTQGRIKKEREREMSPARLREHLWCG